MKIFRDPITHFLLIGLVLVAINSIWTAWQGERGRTIHVSTEEMARLEKLWANTAGRLPTGEDRQMIIDQYVQDEVLMREAERLGLGDDDTIIRRRLAQKMDFLISDNALAEPDEAELRQWFENNRDRFAASERRSFVHVYLSPERHGAQVDAVAQDARRRLDAGADWQTLGDPFIQKRSYAALPQSEITRLFGTAFAERLFALERGQWSEPIGSAYGLHLVRVETIDSAADAEFEPIRAEVQAAWQEQQAIEARQQAIQDLVADYTVIVEEADSETGDNGN
ncbi:Parvulin-like peptidyl-prolyl isomerase [Parasphingorhabdus marina DSM 22363]|uniref:Parvulin-like PPIase n=1 Tax=Parasphingorhabdus marina DSM 22363 TaxID=1123272 RepID=A0A1N6CSN9_9SPHN|nr:peptidylprolyl isomerase [Parasphingorhabdus marina]SIN61495.1 Parvulin-like peptidyl-prolyl isomerase [Parasphingorhabdus marina DSM 22363]